MTINSPTGTPTTVTMNPVATDYVVNYPLTLPEADDSSGALAIDGEVTDAVPFAWAGALFMLGATAFAPFDLSAKPVLHFWAKGDERDYYDNVKLANQFRAT